MVAAGVYYAQGVAVGGKVQLPPLDGGTVSDSSAEKAEDERVSAPREKAAEPNGQALNGTFDAEQKAPQEPKAAAQEESKDE